MLIRAGGAVDPPLFVEERTALVKALRAGKQTEEATRVAALKKPTVAA